MTNRWKSIVDRLHDKFPESDTSVLSALLDQRDVAVRYIAQVHDLTVNEAKETIEIVLGYGFQTNKDVVPGE